MKINVKFEVAPDISAWAAMLADTGWKVTKLHEDRVSSQKVIGNDATYPPRKEIRWYLSVKELPKEEILVTIEVPVFAESVYSRQRLLDTISKLSDQLEGNCKTEVEFELPLLQNLRG
jgi:hypothetical protein